AGSAQAIPDAGGTLPPVDTVLYLVSLHYNSPVDQEEYVLYYYLRLFDSVIVPSDVPSGAWYYGAVEYALKQGLFSGTGADSFSPGGMVTRAQLAQILWRLGGSKQAEASAFSDVAKADWYYSAVSWCSQAGLMSGTGSGFLPNTPLTREQLALVLRQYAKSAGLNTEAGTTLSRFTDGSSASVWAREGLEWAVSQGLLTGYDNGSLKPGSGITRCELAAVLRTFCQSQLGQS
ncbi:MAG: S-layer homology domain-containing protein, partial [Lawsonibacter sp.]|nr:S-layer homology domain-containing protein [Lawsonibacter sp.]